MDFISLKRLFLPLLALALGAPARAQQPAAAGGPAAFAPGERWYDDQGALINAHGGGLLVDRGTYYWYGEKRGEKQQAGVTVYTSKDLHRWHLAGLALSPAADTASDIARGCLMERPKVVYNPRTRQYVMWFHLELRGKGYQAARAGVAVSRSPTGPFRYVHSFRPNGHMSRDMTLFVDDDGAAYQIYSARENYDLRITRLAPDFLTATAQDTLLFSLHREAPAIFKHQGRYYLFTSGCTGWAPNAASLHVAASPWGPWQAVPGNPMQGPGAATTFGGQPTYVLPVPGRPGAFVFIADRWNPQDLADSRYLWLPVQLAGPAPAVAWRPQWDLSVFQNPN